MYSKFALTDVKGFKGTSVESAFQTLLELGWRKSEFMLTGSSALYLLSSTSISRGMLPLIERAPNDIDIFVFGDALADAKAKGISTPSNIGRGSLISLQLAENKADLLDITTDWPVNARVRNGRDFRDMTEEVDGIQVMKPGYILELKDVFNRSKDRPDILSVTRGLHLNRAIVSEAMSSALKLKH